MGVVSLLIAGVIASLAVTSVVLRKCCDMGIFHYWDTWVLDGGCFSAGIGGCATAQVGCCVTAGIDGERCLMDGGSNPGSSSRSVI